MRTTSEKDPMYFGVSLKTGADEYQMRVLIDQDVDALSLSGIDAETIIYMIKNLTEYFLHVDPLDQECTRLYLLHRTNTGDIATQMGLSDADVLKRISKTINGVIDFLKTLQSQHRHDLQ